jgi:glutathione synthase
VDRGGHDRVGHALCASKTPQFYHHSLLATTFSDAFPGNPTGGQTNRRGNATRLIEVDDFIANLWKVHVSVKTEGYVQQSSLGLFRSDYMLHAPSADEPPSLRQVEFNTISSSFAGLSTLVTSLHEHLLTFPDPSVHLAYPSHDLFEARKADAAEPGRQALASAAATNLPPRNDAVQVLRNGLSSAHGAYGISKSIPELPLCVLFIVQEHEHNIFDQLALSSNLNFPVFRLLASQILSYTSIDPENVSRPLVYTPPSSPTSRFEVTTVYFRALYAPSEYKTSESWSARLRLERSQAIKCPSVLAQLAGCKKIQQVLTSTSPDHLRRFLPHTPDNILSSLRSTFAPQYDLSPNSEGLAIALDESLAANHVLKPQREGGGNNIYKTVIPAFLKSLPSTAHYPSYILMELIHPPSAAKNIVLRSDGTVISGNVISELGIFGACLWKRSAAADPGTKSIPQILHNEQGGYLMRTKGKDSDEGGVAAGFSCLDSVLLY